MKRKFAIGVFIVVLLMVALIFGPEIPHDIALSRFRKAFPSVVHLPSSLLLEQFSEVGLLDGANGNHCDYLVGHVRESDATEDEIRDYYAGQVLSVSHSGVNAKVPLYVEFPDTGSMLSGIVRYDIPEVIRAARTKQSRKTLYVVYAFEVGYPPNGDWRCH